MTTIFNVSANLGNIPSKDGERAAMESRLRQLEDEIAETIKRLPAHSVKPPVMIDLLALEDKRDELRKQLARCGEY
jgi:hypothetical protein